MARPAHSSDVEFLDFEQGRFTLRGKQLDAQAVTPRRTLHLEVSIRAGPQRMNDAASRGIDQVDVRHGLCFRDDLTDETMRAA